MFIPGCHHVMPINYVKTHSACKDIKQSCYLFKICVKNIDTIGKLTPGSQVKYKVVPLYYLLKQNTHGQRYNSDTKKSS